MKKKNQANQLVRECIVTALIQLADQKPFSAITVSELTERAGVSRMAYYRNYTSKEDVFRIYMDEIVTSFKKDMEGRKKSRTYGEYDNVLHCFQYFAKYKEFIKCITGIGMERLLIDALNSYLLDMYCAEGEYSVEKYYLLQAYIGSLLTVYMAWLEGGEKEPIEFLAGIIYRRTRKIEETEEL